MGLPQINITFQQLVNTAIQRSERGIVMLLLKGETTEFKGTFTNASEVDASTLTAANKTLVKYALVGAEYAPLKVIVHGFNDVYVKGMAYAETQNFTHFACPGISAGAETTTIQTWIQTQIGLGKRFISVLPNASADKYYIVNFATAGIVLTNNAQPTTSDYTARIVGALAGTTLPMSATYLVLPDVAQVESKTKAQLDADVDAGKLVLMHDGEKVKIARGVTSLTTMGSLSYHYKKIKLVETLMLIERDVTKTLNDNYIGKVPNTYENKQLVCVAIEEYLDGLANEVVIEKGADFDIDIEAQKAYLATIGVAVGTLTDDEIRTYNTRDRVFLLGSFKAIDSAEEFTIKVNI